MRYFVITIRVETFFHFSHVFGDVQLFNQEHLSNNVLFVISGHLWSMFMQVCNIICLEKVVHDPNMSIYIHINGA